MAKLRGRWHNHLCPSVNKEDWTEEEDQLIMEQVQQVGTKWSAIAKKLPGRTDNAIKNRWNSMMRKNLRRQLKEQGGDAVVFQLENLDNLPTRKRGCSTSAEIATAAITAATVNAAAASAIAKGGRNAAARRRAQSRDVPRAIVTAHQLDMSEWRVIKVRVSNVTSHDFVPRIRGAKSWLLINNVVYE